MNALQEKIKVAEENLAAMLQTGQPVNAIYWQLMVDMYKKQRDAQMALDALARESAYRAQTIREDPTMALLDAPAFHSVESLLAEAQILLNKARDIRVFIKESK